MSVRDEVVRIGPGSYRVVIDGRSETVFVAGSAHDRWVFWNGAVFRLRQSPARSGRIERTDAERRTVAAPMPATVLKVLVAPGAEVRRGDTLIILEAMKMELPLRAEADGVVRTLSCREGDLVQAGTPLVDLD